MTRTHPRAERVAGDDGVGLELALAARPDLARVPAVLGTEDLPWLGERQPTTGDGLRRYLCTLELPAGALGPLVFHKAALVGLGALVPTEAGWSLAVSWRATSFAPLFPVLAGRVWIESDQLVLAGRYAPPAGWIGLAIDERLLRLAARGTGRWFLGLLAAAVR
jgi:hypothetical protein